MAEIEIRLVVDKATGKKDVIVTYASDEDALPMEHESAHRAIVDRLIEGGALKAAELGQIVIVRESGAKAPAGAEPNAAAAAEPEKELAGNKQ